MTQFDLKRVTELFERHSDDNSVKELERILKGFGLTDEELDKFDTIVLKDVAPYNVFNKRTRVGKWLILLDKNVEGDKLMVFDSKASIWGN